MAKPKNTPGTATEITDILKVTTGRLQCYLIGTSPLILNRLSEKAKHELLFPRGRKTAVEKETTLKHDPLAEYRASPHILKSDTEATYLALPSTAFKGAIRTAALDMPGAKKAQIGRLTYIEGEYRGVYGVPKLLMRPVRSADMNRTPDIRTRAILPKWACLLEVTYVEPLIRPQAIANLLSAAGITVGVGDWRSEKGSASFGQFSIVNDTDPDFKQIIKTGGRAAQIKGMEDAVPYDDESADLLAWYVDEVKTRTLRGRMTKASTKGEAA